jgi:hypothetical protein
MIGERTTRWRGLEARPVVWLRAWLLARWRRNATLVELGAATGVGLLAFGLRALSVGHAFEIHIDEAIYARISQNVAHSLRLSYDIGGPGPFFLHPPLFFLVEAAYVRLLAPSGDAVQQILGVRYLAASFGGLSGAVLLLLCRRLAGWPAGLAAACVFAVEPFAIRMGSRNFLEPSAMFWVLLGSTLVLHGARGRRAGRVPWSIVAAGAAFGAALLTNEPVAFVTLVPLALWGISGIVARRDAALAGATALGIYAVYPLVVAVTGNFADFRAQKLAGLGRFVGLNVVTGFNGRKGPSFLNAVLASWHEFAPTYGLLALGTLATAWLLFHYDDRGRLVAWWSGSAYALQAYSVLFGTNEEQYFYYVDVLAIVAVVVAAALVVGELRAGRRPNVPVPLRRLLRAPGAPPAGEGEAIPGWSRASLWATAALASMLLAFVALSGEVFVHRLVTRDDGYARLLVYLADNVPRGTRVAATNATDASLLRAAGYDVTDMSLASEEARRRSVVTDPALLTRGRPEYVTVATRLVEAGYGIGSPQLVDWLDQNGELVFSTGAPSDGSLKLYRIEPERRT